MNDNTVTTTISWTDVVHEDANGLYTVCGIEIEHSKPHTKSYFGIPTCKRCIKIKDRSNDSTEAPIYVNGAKVSCRTRHTDNRHERVIEIERTQLNCDYGGTLLARGKVRVVLNELGFNSTYDVLEWVYCK
ncbi:hypothetical protein [Vibrio rotiferianus]|uniref:hypothetical protein n=1 Tax=Vibrio rotiferianus TaxID=190895 RepID=UPI0005F05BDD|nr:hypothetical protein [Vibrio rotiferianus]